MTEQEIKTSQEHLKLMDNYDKISKDYRQSLIETDNLKDRLVLCNRSILLIQQNPSLYFERKKEADDLHYRIVQRFEASKKNKK